MSDRVKTERPIVIFGNGSIAELAHYYFLNDSPRQVAAFTVDAEYKDSAEFSGLPLTSFESIEAEYPPDQFDMFVALGYGKLNQTRQQKFEVARERGYRLASYVCSRLVSWQNVPVGENCFILENQTVQPFCTIGDNVTLWSGNHIGHHSHIADHVFISSHVVISGHCRIGERCFIGVNSTLRDNCTLGSDSFVGMGAAITRDVPEGSVVIGGSSNILGPEDRRAKSLKRNYFGI